MRVRYGRIFVFNCRSRLANGSSSSSKRGDVSTARNQRLNFQKFDDALESKQGAGISAGLMAVEEILTHGQMREKREVLWDVTDATLIRWHEHALWNVRQHLVIELDERGPGATKSSHEVEQRSLARAGRAEDGGDATVNFQIHFERERRERQGNVFEEQAHVSVFFGVSAIRSTPPLQTQAPPRRQADGRRWRPGRVGPIGKWRVKVSKSFQECSPRP